LQQALRKTAMCKFYIAGCCRNATGCDFAHCPEELKRRPDFMRTRRWDIHKMEGQSFGAFAVPRESASMLAKRYDDGMQYASRRAMDVVPPTSGSCISEHSVRLKQQGPCFGSVEWMQDQLQPPSPNTEASTGCSVSDEDTYAALEMNCFPALETSTLDSDRQDVDLHLLGLNAVRLSF